MAIAKKKKDYLAVNIFLGVIIVLLIVLIISVFVSKKRQPNTDEIVSRVINELAKNLNEQTIINEQVEPERTESLISPEEVERLDPDHDGLANYVSEQYGFSIDYPVTWQAAEDETGVLFWDGGTSLVAVNKDGESVSSADNESEEVEEIMVDGVKGKKYYLTAAGGNGEVEVVEIIFPDKNSTDKYSLMSTNYDSSKMIASFKFLSPEDNINNLPASSAIKQ